jgi:H/ACA ribonucleoprotein complex subunit 4
MAEDTPGGWARWKRESPRVRYLERAATDDDPGHGCPPDRRPIEQHLLYGVVNLDKPAGPTSHQVSAWARDIMGLEKAGHGGTLDPRVTGVLPLALGNATRAIDIMLGSGKEYVAVARLHKPAKESHIREVFSEFQGDIYQVPPVKSAVKRKRRKRTIYELEVLEVKDTLVLFRVRCQAGTYIRTLIVDAGEVLGSGAQLAELRRTATGPFREDDAVNLHALRDAWAAYKEDGDEGPIRRCVQPMESLFAELPSLHVHPSAVDAVCHGAPLAVPGVVDVESSVGKGTMVCIRTLKDEAVAMGKSLMGAEQMVDAKEGLVVRPERVVMEPGTYPRNWKSGEK